MTNAKRKSSKRKKWVGYRWAWPNFAECQDSYFPAIWSSKPKLLEGRFVRVRVTIAPVPERKGNPATKKRRLGERLVAEFGALNELLKKGRR